MSYQDLRVTLVQSDIVWENAEQNRRRMAEHIARAEASDVIILPEMFTTGFSMVPQGIAETMQGPSVSWMQERAAQAGCALVGSMIITEAGRFYNRLLWVRPDGTIAHYDKKHLFSFASEDQEYTAGNAQLVVEHRGWRIAPFICYDLRFPLWSRNIDMRYDAALYIASWPEKRVAHWQALLTARAIENQSYVIGVNRVGEDGNQLRYNGHSMLIDPLGEVLIDEAEVESVRSATLSRQHLLDIRERMPFLQDADAFSLI
ncbi:amidohydrolase [Pantoea sp. FN0305]|uniref:amidohydrolase n=1 Tax=Pantoea sp. FN0305 TaxID=3418559 RepID=UPI003CEBE3EB